MSHGQESDGAHGVRGHQLGVGDIGEVSCESWGFGHPSCSDDGGITERKLEPGLFCGHGCHQPDAQRQWGIDRRGVYNGARLGPGLGATIEQGSLVLDGMRGIRLGV